MLARFVLFEGIVRRAYEFTEGKPQRELTSHPFESRNVHPRLPAVVRDLFDDGHYSQATFEAFKFIDKEVGRLAGSVESGFKLMMNVFSGAPPGIRLTPLSSVSDIDEQKGFQFLFAGGILAIRNPRGHEYGVVDDPDTCLDHLAFASMLIRRLEESGYT